MSEMVNVIIVPNVCVTQVEVEFAAPLEKCLVMGMLYSVLLASL